MILFENASWPSRGKWQIQYDKTKDHYLIRTTDNHPIAIVYSTLVVHWIVNMHNLFYTD